MPVCVIPEPLQSNFWWYLIGRALAVRPVLARVLAYTWGRGALIGADGPGRRLILPGEWPRAQWRWWGQMALLPYRDLIKEFLWEIDLESTDGMPSLPLDSDAVIQQFAVARQLAGKERPTGNARFATSQEAWVEYHRQVAAGRLFCPTPVRQGDFWVLPPDPLGGDTESLLLSAVSRDLRSRAEPGQMGVDNR